MLTICISVCSGGCGTDGGFCVATDLCVCPHGFTGTNCEISTPGTAGRLRGPDYPNN